MSTKVYQAYILSLSASLSACVDVSEHFKGGYQIVVLMQPEQPDIMHATWLAWLYKHILTHHAFADV